MNATAPAVHPTHTHPLRPKRAPEKMTSDRAILDELCASTVIAHVAAVVEGAPIAMPTAFAVIDDAIVIHGSTGSRWMRALAGQEVSVSVTQATGLVVARSMFEMSVHYRSAVFFGSFEPVPRELYDEYLVKFTDRMLPGRPAEVRPSTRKELAATSLVKMPIDRWSLRVSEGMPEDDPVDVPGDAWSGTIEFALAPATVTTAPDVRPGIEVPPSVRAFAANPVGVV